MTRSSARRRNKNARIIASYTLWGAHFGHAFTGDGTRSLAQKIDARVHPRRWHVDEVNWELCAELLNRIQPPREREYSTAVQQW